MAEILDIFMRLDVHLGQWAQMMGVWLYLLLFMIIFCETGLVVTPFLPGDSLLFAVGALAALPDSPIQIGLIWGLLILAAFLGDNLNYRVGRWVGPKAFSYDKSFWFNPKNLERTQGFYSKYGHLAVALGRFAPIVRTFVPFIAGVGKMEYRKFWLFSLGGSIVWMSLFLGGGYIFGNLPFVKRNFQYVILAVIILSLLPIMIGAFKKRSAPQT